MIPVEWAVDFAGAGVNWKVVAGACCDAEEAGAATSCVPEGPNENTVFPTVTGEPDGASVCEEMTNVEFVLAVNV